MKKRKKIIVVLPSYNSAKTLEKTVKDIPKGAFDEILMVDDGSTDNSIRVAQKLGIKYFVHEKNKGYGANQKTCYKQALKRNAEIIVMLHPDYQYDPKILPSLTAPIEYGYADVTLGSRMLGNPHFGGALQGGMPLYKFLSNKILTFFQNKLLGMHFSEYHTGYRAYNAKMLKKINFSKFSDDYIFDNQILLEFIKRKAKFIEVPVKTVYFKEASSINVFKSILYGLGVIKLTFKLKSRKHKVNVDIKTIRQYQFLTVLISLGFILIAFVENYFKNKGYIQFISLADSFLHGKLYLLNNAHEFYDAAFYNGHYYWPLGPFPAILLMPFVYLSNTLYWQMYVQFFLVLFLFLVIYLLSFNITKNKLSSVWTSVGYIFSTAFIGVAVLPFSWQFAQVVQNLLVMLAILGVFKKWKPFIIGSFIALAVATRVDMVFSIIFFLIILLSTKEDIYKKIKNVIYFLVPIGITGFTLLYYNFLRFGKVFEQGYTLQHLVYPELIANRAAGIWSLIHFPANLYYLFLKGPDPVLKPGTQILTLPFIQSNSWGMSIFITSPMFLAIFMADIKNKYVKSACLTSLIILISILGYYGIGWTQFGYRYALDFYPFLLVIFLFAVKSRFPRWVKILITITFFTNFYFI